MSDTRTTRFTIAEDTPTRAQIALNRAQPGAPWRSMTRARKGWLALSALISIVIGFTVAWQSGRHWLFSGRYRPVAIPSFLAEEAFERERAEATALGMVLAEELEEAPAVHSGYAWWSHGLEVAPRECVAVIATTSGHLVPSRLGLLPPRDGGSPIALVSQNPDGLVAHVQWCELEGRTLSIELQLRQPSEYEYGDGGAGTLRVAVYRGAWNRVGGPMRLTRGTIRANAFNGAPPSLAVEAARRLAPRNGTPLGPFYDIGFASGARLIPFGLDTYALLYVAGANDAGVRVNPAVDRSEHDGGAGFPASSRQGFHIAYYAMNVTAPPDASVAELNALLAAGRTPTFETLRAGVDAGAAPPSHLPVAGSNYDFVRVLAVVDPAQLGADCIALTFTRLVFGERAAVSQLMVDPLRAALPLPSVENVATDTVCPTTASSPRMYTVPRSDQAIYRFQAYALHLATGADASSVATDASSGP